MTDAVEFWERPTTKELYMFVGWRQWADAGSISSALPKYLIQKTKAEHIGELHPEGFYLFQIPGTHGLVRPVVHFSEGLPEALDAPQNEFYYAGDENRGVVFFLGDEPHLDAERYVKSLLDAAEELGVKRIVGFGGVYGELPYEKERMVSCVYSLPHLKQEVEGLAVNLSDYEGGASIGSYVCRRAGERDMEYVAFYAFVPTYDFSEVAQIGSTIQIENDFMAWLGVMRRVNHMLKLEFDLSDLVRRSAKLVEVVEEKIEKLDQAAPQFGVRDYFARLSEQFEEVSFMPLGDVWDEELDRLLDDFDLE